MEMGTKLILIPCIMTDIDESKVSVMAVLICILGDCAWMASFRFLKSTPRRYRNSKKIVTFLCDVPNSNFRSLSNKVYFSLQVNHLLIADLV